jgi:hypothetical protein
MEIENYNPNKDIQLKTIFKEIPKIKMFTNIDTFQIELDSYIKQFAHTEKYIEPDNEVAMSSLIEVKNKILEQVNTNIYFMDMLKNTPWRLSLKEVRKHFDAYYYNTILPKESVIQIYDKFYKNEFNHPNSNCMPLKLNRFYQAIFIVIKVYNVKLIERNIKIILTSVIGKKKNGKYDFIGNYYINQNNYSAIFEDFRKRGIIKIRIITSYLNMRESIQNNLYNYFPRTKFQCCLTELFKRIKINCSLSQDELNYIDKLFTANTLLKARRIYNENKFRSSVPIKKVNNLLAFTDNIYEYKLKERNMICTTNIVTYICNFINILLEKNKFSNKGEAILFINFATKYILENGKNFIPNWDFLSNKID